MKMKMKRRKRKRKRRKKRKKQLQCPARLDRGSKQRPPEGSCWAKTAKESASQRELKAKQ